MWKPGKAGEDLRPRKLTFSEKFFSKNSVEYPGKFQKLKYLNVE